jgi:hypothetical protein
MEVISRHGFRGRICSKVFFFAVVIDLTDAVCETHPIVRKSSLFGKRKGIPMDFIALALGTGRTQAPILQTVRELDLRDEFKFNAWLRAALMAKLLGSALNEIAERCAPETIM